MQQMAINFEPGLAQRYRDLRECFAACVYGRGLGRLAAAVDQAPSNLSAMLSGERHLPTDVIESYMQHFHDTTPALYLAARYLQDSDTLRRQAIAEIPNLVAQLQRLVQEAGQ